MGDKRNLIQSADNSRMTKTILITGCSTGIGWHCAIGMKQRGWRVIATARTEEDLKRLEAEGLEAIHPGLCGPCLGRGLRRRSGKAHRRQAGCPVQQRRLWTARCGGRPDARSSGGAVRRQFLWLAPADARLPALDARQWRGRIVQCSSVLGLVALKWRGAYNSSKFAIEATVRHAAARTARLRHLRQPHRARSHHQQVRRDVAEEFREEHRPGEIALQGSL